VRHKTNGRRDQLTLPKVRRAGTRYFGERCLSGLNRAFMQERAEWKSICSLRALSHHIIHKNSHAEYSYNFDFFPVAERGLGWTCSTTGRSCMYLPP